MKRFRPNVCAVLTNPAGDRVLVFRRADSQLEPYSWQFPQGGLEPGEEPRAGMLRELREEVGTDDAVVLASLPEPIRYEYPPEIKARLGGGDPDKAHWDGQEQHWFLARLTGGVEAIRFDHQPQEFDAYRWVRPEQAVELVVPFKKRAYRRALQKLGLLAPAGK